MKYQINPSATLLTKRKDGEIIVRFLLDGSRTLHDFSVSDAGENLLRSLYEATEESVLYSRLGVNQEDLHKFLRPLLGAGLVLPEKDFLDTAILGPRWTRTLEFFRSFSAPGRTSREMADLLRASRVLVLGLGGIGSWVAEALVRIGVGEILVVDPDTVEESNLSRQAIYRKADIGLPKAEVVRVFAEEIGGDARVMPAVQTVSAPEALRELLAGVRLVVNCADKPDVDTTNGIVSVACFAKRVPHILCGGYDGHLSSLGQTVVPGETSCWFCYADSGIHEAALDGFEIVERASPDVVGGTIGPVAALVASLQAQEAVRLLTGCSPPLLANARAEMSFSSLAISVVVVPRLKNCKLCSKLK